MAKKNAKIGIYGAALLMMGVIGVSGSLATIGANFPDASQTMIQNIVSIPCLVIIPVTLIVGKLMESVSKRNLALIGIILFLIGGVGPAFTGSFTVILVMRGVLGLGIGLIQPVASALVAENYEGAERDKVQGTMTSCQMLGCAVMVFAGGWLGSLVWNATFYVHALAIVSLFLVLAFVPNIKPESTGKRAGAPTVNLTKLSWIWALLMLLFFISGQIYSIFCSFLVTEKGLGSAAQAGNSLAFFAIGGFLMGLVFGKLSSLTKGATLAVGFFLLAISYVLIAFAGNMVLIYLGSIICGFAFSICMPCITVGAAGAVDPFSAAMAISVAMCAQNLSQFICPYIVNPVAAALSGGTNVNQAAFLFGAVFIAVMGVIVLVWGLSQNRKKVPVG